MYQLQRIFCATPWELEAERQIFYDVVGAFNENEAMKQGVLYVPVSLLNIRDKRPYQYTVDDNIRDSHYYILLSEGGWGPAERNFQRDYHLALLHKADASMPMREVTVLIRRMPGLPEPALEFPQSNGSFSTADEFQRQLRSMLSRWTTNYVKETGASASAASGT